MDRQEEAGVLECRVAFMRDTARVQPIGEVDFATAPLVAQRLEDVRAAGAGHVVLDLRETTFFDSAGLHLALDWQERARREQFTFALAEVPRRVRRVFDASGIGAALNVVSEAP